ncbi:hypothetical protein Mnod_0989 [Methylobacterium nodulans ORS 2060]|uniref:Uncharacterized protein n=1 Tax=Methylobacterium nodulans (strain LMG 21967 / CNCM I-2342 / ORS 2060) TaxID=460265 RepID=B8IHW3_METNO|nr:hypothetical protein Mnod_0989 [Methylobacterium nodulans ORS 2060]
MLCSIHNRFGKRTKPFANCGRRTTSTTRPRRGGRSRFTPPDQATSRRSRRRHGPSNRGPSSVMRWPSCAVPSGASRVWNRAEDRASSVVSPLCSASLSSRTSRATPSIPSPRPFRSTRSPPAARRSSRGRSDLTATPSNGGAARTISEWTGVIDALIARQSVNALEFVSAAAVSASADVSEALRKAVAAARSAGRPLIVPGLGSSCHLVNGSVDVSGVEIIGAGACISTTAGVSTFTTTGPLARVHGLIFSHTDPSGSVFSPAGGESHEIHDNRITARHGSNADPIIYFIGSNTYIHSNKITNLRPNALSWEPPDHLVVRWQRMSATSSLLRERRRSIGKRGETRCVRADPR